MGNSRSTNVLIVTDHFTKYAQAYVTPKQTAVVVARALWENFLYIMDGLRKSLQIKANPLKTI